MPTHNDVFKKGSFPGAYAEPKRLYAESVFDTFLFKGCSTDAYAEPTHAYAAAATGGYDLL